MNTTPDPSADSDVDGLEQPFITHLIELRDRLLRIVLAVVVIFACLFPFANQLYSALAGPLMAHLPEGSTMIAIEVASPFLTPFKLALVSSIFLAVPVILYQMWAFVAPGLYRHEQRLVIPLLVSSTALFYLGMAFAYYVVFPLVFGFLSGTAHEGVSMMTDINKYLDFVLTIFFAFGLAFEVPIATVLLVWAGVTTPEKLKTKRPYIVVGAFVIGMVLTPPDVISQTLLAIPMLVLFEAGLIFARLYQPKREEDDDADDEADDYSEMSDAEMEADLDAMEEADVDELSERAREQFEEDAASLESEIDELGDDGEDESPERKPD
jgi:sec-independent protein translocase protein TatC